MTDFSYLIGKTEDQAREALKEHDMVLRVTSEDGEHFFGTCDYRTDRLNVGITKGVLSSIGNIG
jgi:hypothetical protein